MAHMKTKGKIHFTINPFSVDSAEVIDDVVHIAYANAETVAHYFDSKEDAEDFCNQLCHEVNRIAELRMERLEDCPV